MNESIVQVGRKNNIKVPFQNLFDLALKISVVLTEIKMMISW